MKIFLTWMQRVLQQIFSKKTGESLMKFTNQTLHVMGRGFRLAKNGTVSSVKAAQKAHQEGKFERMYKGIQHFGVQILRLLAIAWRNHFIRYGVIIVLGTILIIKKDFYLGLNITSPYQQEVVSEPLPKISEKNQEKQTPKPEKIADKVELKGSIFDEIPTHLLRNFPTQADSNLANTFSNLGFIMNPGLAKKLKVSSRIVALKKQKCQSYINQFAPIAVEEMKKYGVPASITLAQGLLESNVGDSKLAKRNKNHFGIKCFKTSCTTGHCTNYTDDSHKDFFRKYESDWQSYREHSVFLQRQRYIHLKEYGKDYKKWAHGLRKAGYATDKKYGSKLIKIIEVLELYQFDKKV